MNVAGKALLVGDALEKCGEVLALRIAEGSQQGALMFAGDLAHSGEGLLSFFSEDKLVAAAVAGTDVALGQAECVQLVKQSDQTAGDHAQAFGQGLLCKAGRGFENMQNAGVGRSKPNFGKPLGVFARRVTSELGQQESGAEGAARRGGMFFLAGGRFHESIIARRNHAVVERLYERTNESTWRFL